LVASIDGLNHDYTNALVTRDPRAEAN